MPATEQYVTALWLDLPDIAPRKRLISLTPLIDVVFILLVFFMLASSSIDWRAIGFNAGQGAASATGDRPPPLLVEIDINGIVTVNGQSAPARMAGDLVEAQLNDAAMVKSHTARAVLVVPQPGVNLQEAVSVLDAITQIGVQQVSLSRPTIVPPAGLAQ